MNLDAKTFRDLLADPAAVEIFSAATGCPLVIVEVSDGSASRWLTGLDITGLPAVVVAVAPDPAWLPALAAGAADIVLTENSGTAAPYVTPEKGLSAATAAIKVAVTASPIAATSLALLLRTSAGMPVAAGLIAESATYSVLQEGAEFRRWRSAHPPRAPEAATDRVLVERSPGELRIILARPGRRNAVDWRMRDALVGALTIAIGEPGAQITLRANGPDFCAGGDLDEFGSRLNPAHAHIVRLTRSPAMLLHQIADRTTAYLHGHCLGAGIELPAFAARVAAAEDTKIGLPEIGLGLIPGAGGTVSLPRRAGRWRTAYLALAGDTLDAKQALAWGLIDEIRPQRAGLCPLSRGLTLEHGAGGSDYPPRLRLHYASGHEDNRASAADNLSGSGHVFRPAGYEADRKLDQGGRAPG